MEAWEIREEQKRIPDSLPTFIIFCEDEVSEPVYFKYFETDSIKVNTIEGQKSKYENVLKAINHCERADLMQEKDGKPFLINDEIQVWCVFDRDKEGRPELESFGNTNFNESIHTALNKGIRVAWSNDAFELWVLLHFEEVNPNDPATRHRSNYYDRLTEIFLALPNPGADLKRITSIQSFYYKEAMKGRKHFTNIVRNEMVARTNVAITRAKALEQYHSGAQSAPYQEKPPCTLVHNLVEELIRLAGKSIP